jgi:hypothetical protein
MSDDLGRFTKWNEFDATHDAYGYSTTKIVGQVIDVQKFGVTYDTQLMEFLKYSTDEFQDDFNALTEARPFLATSSYVTMFETGVTASSIAAGYKLGIDDALDRYGAEGMITIALML